MRTYMKLIYIFVIMVHHIGDGFSTCRFINHRYSSSTSSSLQLKTIPPIPLPFLKARPSDEYSVLDNNDGLQDITLNKPTRGGVRLDGGDRTVIEIRTLFCARSMLRIGKRGVHPNHLKSLSELVAYHGVVKVKVSDYKSDIDDVISELTEAHNVKLLSIHWTGRYLLFEQKVRKIPPQRMKKYDTRGDKTCWECGEVGHVAYDCMNKIRTPPPVEEKG